MALVRFTSPAAGEIYMFEDNANTILDLLGKEKSPKGIITAQQVPGALATLRAAVERERAVPDDAAKKGVEPDERDADAQRTVKLGQRAFPLIDMLERAAKKNVEVLWGV